MFASKGDDNNVYAPYSVTPPTVVGMLTVNVEPNEYPWFGKRTVTIDDPAVVVKYGVCPGKVAVCVPDPALDVLIKEPDGVNDILNVVALRLRTKYCVPAVMPVGNDPVVVNVTTVPVTGADVTVMTAGEAVVIVAV